MTKFFKLVECDASEVKNEPAYVIIGKSHSEVMPIATDWARHITEGSAGICGIDNLIKIANSPLTKG